MQKQLNPLQQATWNCCSSLTSIVFLFFHIKPQLLWDELRWAQLHCLETAVSIMSAGTPLRSKSLILVLVIICVDSHQSNWKNNHELHRLLLLLVKKSIILFHPSYTICSVCKAVPSHTWRGVLCLVAVPFCFVFIFWFNFFSFFFLFVLQTYSWWHSFHISSVIKYIYARDYSKNCLSPNRQLHNKTRLGLKKRRMCFAAVSLLHPEDHFSWVNL